MTRTRKIVLAVLLGLLALGAASCDVTQISSANYKTADGTNVHWLSNRAGTVSRQIELMVPAEFASSSQFMYAANFAVQQANRTGVVHVVLDSPATIPTKCDPGWHCVVATRRPMNGGVAYLAWDAGGHMYGLRRIMFDSAPWTQSVLNNAFCHEFFHQLGLAHSPYGVQGPCRGAATDWDLALVRLAHNHPDLITQAQAEVEASRSGQKARTLVVGHTRAEYERMTRGAS